MGASVTLAGDLALTPVFTANTKTLADRTEAVALTWPFHPNQGCPTFNAQGSNNGTGIYVTQATVAGEVIDVKLDYDATSGKLSNAGRTTWTQINTGTKLTVPSCKGAVVSAEFYSSTSATTIDGQTDYTAGTSISYTVASTSETIDIVMGDNNYIGNLAVTLPVVQSSGGDSFDNVAGTINWPVGNEETPTIASDIAGAVASATVSVGSGLTASVAQYFNKNMMKYQPTNSNAGNVEEVMIEYRVKMAAGVKFTPVSVSFDAVKVGTNNATFSYSYTTDDIESTITDMNASTVLRNDNSNASSAELNHSLDVSAASECEVFTFRFYISKTANNKQIALGNIVITGTVNGEVQEVTTYALDVVASPAEGGSVSLYPADGEYEEGAEVKATATENFGYDFVNWTNSAGDVVSQEAQFIYTMPANAETLTANFEAVDTYELALTVEGTNDYMVTLSPAPTVVDGKNMYEAGTVVTVTANQYEGLVTFTNWSNGQTAAEINVTMNDDVTLTANYEQADIIAGWDFYKKGNSGRPADFASEDNISTAFNLTNGTSATSWLDKSTEAANGYESFKGAAVNWKTPVGEYYWQTKLNAEQFKDINLQFQMLYNYNAYTTYKVEYSLDGTEWTTFGSITMVGAKTVASFNETLPEECNNQASLYIRWIPDYDSNIAGADGNDGNTIAMVFFTGTQQMADDEVPPVLLSTVPEDGATGASATGKVVLTFDEKVQVAEGTTATLGDITLEPSVLGKTVTFSYKGLDYATAYTFTLGANSVSDLSGNAYAEPVTLSFTTMERPAVTKGLYDWVVPTDGTLEDAIAAANSRPDKSTRYRIFLMDGTYTLPKSATATIHSDDGNDYPSPITYLNASNVSIIGESTDGVVITNDLADAATFAGQFGTVSVYDGISNSDVLQIGSSVTGTYFQNVTIKSGIADALGRNIAVQDRGSKTIYKDVCLWGYQDTWTSNNNNGLYYFENGVVRGRTDFLCGKGDAYFNEVDIQVCMNTGGYIAVPSTPAAKGWVFANCTIKGESSSLNGAYTLGRPWGSGTPIALWINTTMEVIPSAIGWSEMSNGWPARFAEYNSMTSSGGAVDLSGRKTTFGADLHENNPVLSDEEATAALDMSAMFGEWEPTLYTEQAPLPENVVLNGTTLTWDDSDYALLWAICKDGKVVDFTNEPTFEVDDATATWSVRAANEMGGLSEATEATVEEATISVTISASTYSTLYYQSKALAIPDGVTAYTAKKNENTITLTPIEGVIPADCPVVLNGDPGTYEFAVTTTSLTAPEDNDLIGSEEGGTYSEEGYNYYVLCWKNKQKKVEEVGFYFQSGSQGAYAKVKAHQAYMRVPKTNASADGYTFEFDSTTGITSVEQVIATNAEVYTLSGIRVSNKNLPKGVYIVNGRKVVVK